MRRAYEVADGIIDKVEVAAIIRADRRALVEEVKKKILNSKQHILLRNGNYYFKDTSIEHVLDALLEEK